MSTDVEKIKERLNIVDVISSYIKVEKAGINYKARCPFHNEKTASFFISPTRQSFYCFGCGEKGDAFSFVEKFEGLDFKGALESLANRAGVTLSKTPEAQEKKEAKDELFDIMEKATEFYEGELQKNPKILEYLKNRGLTANSISEWKLGYSPVGWRNLHDYLLSKGFTRENMLLSGLIKKVGDENKYYDTFRERVMFPISDANGKVIAFSGRALQEDEKTPKYLNSPETKLFYKSEVLYGFNIAKNFIRRQDYAVLVEGQMDLLMSQQAGVQNTVASSGTALTELHLKKIQKLSNRIVIAYDSDNAGEKAARRAAELALLLGMEVKIVSLPKGEDPDSIIKKNPEEWKTALKESEHFTDFALNKAVRENEGRNLAREIAKNVLPLVPLIKSDIEKAQFVKKIALKMKVNEEAVWSDIKKIKTEIETQKHNDKEEIIQDFRDQKEALMFEAEKYGLKIDVEKTNEEILRRTEIKELKQKFQEIAITLDDKDVPKEEREKLKEDLKNIEKRIKEINF
jgi:DNA primase